VEMQRSGLNIRSRSHRVILGHRDLRFSFGQAIAPCASSPVSSRRKTGLAKETRRHPCNRREWATWSRVGPLCPLYKCCWDRIETRVQTFPLLQRRQQAAVAPARGCAPWWVRGKRVFASAVGTLRQAQQFLAAYVMSWKNARSPAPPIGTHFLLLFSTFNAFLVRLVLAPQPMILFLTTCLFIAALSRASHPNALASLVP
jgi:hypothetical protein